MKTKPTITIKRKNWRKADIDDNGKAVALISCPRCNRLIGLRKNRIRDDGKVKSDFICGYDDCEFRGKIKLERW